MRTREDWIFRKQCIDFNGKKGKRIKIDDRDNNKKRITFDVGGRRRKKCIYFHGKNYKCIKIDDRDNNKKRITFDVGRRGMRGGGEAKNSELKFMRTRSIWRI